MTGDEHTIDPARLRMRVGLGAVVVLLIIGLMVAVVVSALAAPGGARATRSRPHPSTATPLAPAVFVHVIGAVNKPGLYQLREGDRTVDAIAAAGGYSDSADRSRLNLARILSDGEQIQVLAIGESPPAAAAPGTIGGKVNLNTADAATLETLPRIGPAMAGRIIAWRQKNGRFASVKDLLNITGFGEKMLAELKELVTV